MSWEDKRIICVMCNRVCMKLIPLYDHDNAHKLTQCCVDCKRKIKKGQPIVKFERREGE